MKRFLAIILAITLAFSMTVFVHAEDEVEIPLDADHLTGSPDYFAPADALTFGDGTVTADQVEIIAFALPQNVVVGQTVTVHIKGTSVGDFRVWLIGADVTANKGDHATFSNMWKASENGFTTGEFDFEVVLTAVDAEPIGGTEANKVCFKAPASHGILDNLTVTYLSITYPSAEDIEAAAQAALQDVQEYIDQSESALAAAQSASGDKAALEAALADAQAAVDAISASESANNAAVIEALGNAKQVVADIQALVKAVDSAEVMSELQSYIDTANNALATAQNAGSDVEAVETALADAKAAFEHVKDVANATGYSDALAASRELKSVVGQIEDLVETSKELKAKEDAEAAAQAAADAEKADNTSMVIIIAFIAVVVIAVIAVVILGVLKKKKK